MNSKKISALSSATSLSASDVAPWVSGGSTKKATATVLADLLQSSSGFDMPARGELSYTHASKFGCVLDGSTDDTANLQAALSSGENITLGGKTAKITSPLYMSNDRQAFAHARLSLAASLGCVALYLGASDASGTPAGAAIVSPYVNVRIIGSGSKAAGSAGLSLVNVTTATIDRLVAWGLESGALVSGVAICNLFLNPDLRSNIIGFNDPSTVPASTDIQASLVLGGRIEANEQEGIIIGSPNVKFVGTTIEGNGSSSVGGDGTHAEVLIPSGTTTHGTLTFQDCYFESISGKTVDGIIKIAGTGTSRTIVLNGGEYYANDPGVRHIISSESTATVQQYILRGGSYHDFKGYVSAALSANGLVFVAPDYADSVVNADAYATVSNGAQILQFDRANGQRTTANIRANNVLQTSATDAGYRYGGYEVSYRIVGGSALTTVEIIPAGRISADLDYLVEVIGIAKASGVRSALHAQILITGGGGITAVTDWSVLYEYQSSATMVAVSVNGSNGVQLTALQDSGSRIWDFQITMRAIYGV